MTKKVAKRSWSLEKFGDAVKAACERQGTKYQSSKIKALYEGDATVAYAAASMGATKAPAKPAKAKAAAAAA